MLVAMQQRNVLRLRALLAACALAVPALAARAFGFDDVAREAAALAAKPYTVPPADPALAALSYDAYRSIRFRPERALWKDAGLNFEAYFYPLGRTFTRPLRLHEVVDGQARVLEVPAAAFRNDGDAKVRPAAGAAGFRLNFPLNDPKRTDELIVFLGASYFRVLSSGLHYGLSARGLAIDTTGGDPEECPSFTAFWLERPAAGAKTMRFWALLDSPRATGAYAFTVQPGSTTVVDVRAQVHLRAPVKTLGIAPLTSMFLAGENQPVADDYRPEVHDSDGLQILAPSGEWLWRPLVNPRGTFVTSFAMPSLRGFGLMQRDRGFGSYQDLEARYDMRPSAWVEPIGDWGPGRVELLQFHTPNETHDNIGAFWVPQKTPLPGQPVEFSWRLHVGGQGLFAPPGAWVVQSRRGHGYRETPIPPAMQQFHIDFDGPALKGLVEADAVQAVASGNDNVKGLRAIAQPNPVQGGWRVTLDFERLQANRPVELRVYLRAGDKTLSETWAYALPPE